MYGGLSLLASSEWINFYLLRGTIQNTVDAKCTLVNEGFFNLTIATEISAPTQFIVQRNQSLSWHENKIFICYIAVLSLGIASVFAYQGLWLILPFAGIEILALTLGLYVCCVQGQEREVITVDNENLLIETGRLKPEQHWQFNRTWLQLELKESQFERHPSQLIVRSKGKEIEIAKKLTNKERKSLAKSLAQALSKPLIKSHRT